MIALVSFPRSGNTFFRNVLHDVYGLPSSTFHLEHGRDLDENWASYPVIKTHLLPSQLPPEMAQLKVVYLVRDGRDALVSLAHHRKDIVESGTDFYNNLLEAILSPGGSNFGGWSQNVKAWTERADLVIRFEDLIADPIGQAERLREIIDLPAANPEKLPTFQQLKHGQPTYGAGSGNHFNPAITVKNFRRGKTGAWRDEMPAALHELFWRVHGAVMENLEYTDGQVSLDQRPRRILIEAAKAFSADNDGVKRYTIDLLNHLSEFIPYYPEWEFDLINGNTIMPLKGAEFSSFLGLLAIKDMIKRMLPTFIYEPLAKVYRRGPFRSILSILRNIKAKREQTQPQVTKRALTVERYDLVHALLPQHLSFLPDSFKRCVVTVHDLTHQLFPEYHFDRNIDLANEGFALANQHNAHYLTISDATTRDLQKLWSISPDRMTRIYEGASGKFNRQYERSLPKEIRAFYRLPSTGKYLMTLSTVEPRKNLQRVIDAFKEWHEHHPDEHVFLCVVGKKGWLSDDLYDQEAQLRKQNIVFTGFVDDGHLPQLLRSAEALCYVSHYEGFGLPILEAMQCGTPVIYGNNSSQPEVAGAAGIGVDSQDTVAIAKAMEQILSDANFRSTLSEKAWAQARTFSCWKMAYETLCLYDKLTSHAS